MDPMAKTCVLLKGKKRTKYIDHRGESKPMETNQENL